jgi:hypothetical protein
MPGVFDAVLGALKYKKQVEEDAEKLKLLQQQQKGREAELEIFKQQAQQQLDGYCQRRQLVDFLQPSGPGQDWYRRWTISGCCRTSVRRWGSCLRPWSSRCCGIAREVRMTHTTIGPCELYLADCRDLLPILQDIITVLNTVLITDPPYGIGTRHKRSRDNLVSLDTEHLPIVGDDAPFDPAHLFALGMGSEYDRTRKLG